MNPVQQPGDSRVRDGGEYADHGQGKRQLDYRGPASHVFLDCGLWKPESGYPGRHDTPAPIQRLPKRYLAVAIDTGADMRVTIEYCIQ